MRRAIFGLAPTSAAASKSHPPAVGLSHAFARSKPLTPSAYLAAALLGLFAVLLYARISLKLVHDWYSIPDYSHGLLIPFFAAYFLWDRRHVLRSTPLLPTWAGLPLVLLGLGLLLIGVFGADLFLSRVSFLPLTAGVVWCLLGAAMLKQLRFLFVVMLLGVPLPALLLNHITFPLQLFASKVSAAILPIAGVPLLREGNVLRLPALSLEVAEACSGIRSLMSLCAFAILYGYFEEPTLTRRTLLALASIPIAVAANVLRIVGTGLCVQYWDPVKAMGFFHEFSGWLMFLVSLGCLYLVHLLLQKLLPGPPLALAEPAWHG